MEQTTEHSIGVFIEKIVESIYLKIENSFFIMKKTVASLLCLDSFSHNPFRFSPFSYFCSLVK